MSQPLTPDLLIWAYRQGVFPMADPDEDDAIYWFRPEVRGVLPLDGFHVPKNVAKLVRRQAFDVTTDQDFEAVVRACAAPAPGRESTWISEEIVRAYTELHRRGLGHSVECRQDGRLVGGLYGVALGGAFFGESMFHRVPDASKVALVHLVQRLHRGGFVLLDTQDVTPHLQRFGVIGLPRRVYERRLALALRVEARWGG